MSEMPAPEWGGPETETAFQITPPPAEVDYRLMEIRVAEGSFEDKLSYIPMLLASGDPVAASIGINALPDTIAEGIAMGNVPSETLDALRELWKAAMKSNDEELAYEAQLIYTFEEKRLERADVTTFGWLKDSVTVEWFDG